MSNLATNFREAIAENARSVDLNPDQFGEWVTFYPANGGAARRLVASIEASSRPERDDTQEYLVEEIVVMVSDLRHDAERGGIDRPRSGDRLKRDGEEELYAWTGEVRAAEAGAWHLTYARRRMVRKGGARNQ